MSGTEWDDEEPDYPRAPLPPHERVWRHPSELGQFALVSPAPTGRRPHTFSRLTLAGCGVVTVALAVGLVQLLLPRSGSSVTAVSTQVSSSRLLPVAGNSAPEGFTNTDPVTSARVRTSGREAATTPAPTPSLTPATRPDHRPAAVVPTVMLASSNRAAVPVGDGRHALTTAVSLVGGQTIEVQGADGSSMTATVTSVDTEANVAILELGEPSLGAAPDIADELPSDGDLVTIGGNEAAVLRETAEGLVVDGATPCDEGTPVLDEGGALVGLATTTEDGTVHLVTLPDPAHFEAALLVVDVWVGVRFDADTLTITEVPPGSPADLVGVLPGDVMLSLDGIELRSLDDVWTALAPHQPNDVVELVVERGPVQISYLITLDVRPD